MKTIFRSKYERRLREWLEARNVKFLYESRRFTLSVPIIRGQCGDCRSTHVVRFTEYTPDWFFPETGMYVESKGKFDARARRIALAMQDQHPDVSYSLLLQRDNWLTKTKKQRYSDWCKKNLINFHIGETFPREWVTRSGSLEPSSVAPSVAARSSSRGAGRRKR